MSSDTGVYSFTKRKLNYCSSKLNNNPGQISKGIIKFISEQEILVHDVEKELDTEEVRRSKWGPMARLRRRMKKNSKSAVILEKRILVSVTGSTVVAVLLWVVAVATDFWFTVHSPEGAYINRTGVIFLNSHSGLWRICKSYILNATKQAQSRTIYNCQYHTLFPTDQEIIQDPELDGTILNYTRTETSFSIISLFLMVMSIGFSLYTFKEPRYMFKRLAGGVHFLTAASVLVVIEVLVNSVKYEEQFLTARHPKGAIWSYGFSFVLAWLTFLIILIAGITFIVCSRKRKGSKAATEYEARENETNILGRL